MLPRTDRRRSLASGAAARIKLLPGMDPRDGHARAGADRSPYRSVSGSVLSGSGSVSSAPKPVSP
jgi:hypothetical protein